MGKAIETILEILQRQAESTVELADIMFTDRSTSYRKARRSLLKAPPQFKTEWADWYRKRQTFYSLLNQLKREGLVKKEKRGNSSLWKITKRGILRLTEARDKGKRETLPMLSRKKYEAEKNNELAIVAFDIPERERKKRDWLRVHLAGLGFSSLQKSVWMGKVGIPEAFIKDLRDYEMIPYVQIFSVNKQGTIKKTF